MSQVIHAEKRRQEIERLVNDSLENNESNYLNDKDKETLFPILSRAMLFKISQEQNEVLYQQLYFYGVYEFFDSVLRKTKQGRRIDCTSANDEKIDVLSSGEDMYQKYVEHNQRVLASRSGEKFRMFFLDTALFYPYKLSTNVQDLVINSVKGCSALMYEQLADFLSYNKEELCQEGAFSMIGGCVAGMISSVANVFHPIVCGVATCAGLLSAFKYRYAL